MNPQPDPFVLLRAIEQNPASIIFTDPDGTIIYVNPRCCEVTGFGHEELIGKSTRLPKGGA